MPLSPLRKSRETFLSVICTRGNLARETPARGLAKGWEFPLRDPFTDTAVMANTYPGCPAALHAQSSRSLHMGR
jgi:hypothetical protein